MKIAAACFLILFSMAVTAQPVEWSQDFNRPGLVGRVFALGTWEGDLYAGGYEFEARGSMPSRVARFDGSRWRPLIGSQGEGVSGQVRAMAVFDGELVVAGHFGGAGGVPANGVAAWNGNDWRALGGGVQLSYDVAPTVFALEVFQGELYAGGLFDSAEGQPVIGIARWDGSTWRPVGGGIDGPYDPKVLSLEADPVAGLLYVGGEFDEAGGVAAANIAAWNGTSWQAVGSGIPGPTGSGVHALAVFQGGICAGGNFALSSPAAARRIACFDGSEWQALGNGIPD
ncbi:MAG: hypothetical protein R3323_10725, partial [Wenzhouxiangellaceae bacterium]|nr:hypothetical protein [Wenzhouxiangellaceae bacterium]